MEEWVTSHDVQCANNGEPTYTCKRMRRKFVIDLTFHVGKIKVSDWRPVPEPSFSDHACVAYSIHWDDLEGTAGEFPRQRTKAKVTKFSYDRPTGKSSTKYSMRHISATRTPRASADEGKISRCTEPTLWN